MTTERRYIVPSRPDEDVAPDKITPAYRFGKDLVPVDHLDGERLKYGVPEKVLQLIGLVPEHEVPRHMLTSRPECVVPPPEGTAGGDDANKALQALLNAMAEEGLVGIARYAPTKGKAPQLVSLWPNVTHFWMLQVRGHLSALPPRRRSSPSAASPSSPACARLSRRIPDDDAISDPDARRCPSVTS